MEDLVKKRNLAASLLIVLAFSAIIIGFLVNTFLLQRALLRNARLYATDLYAQQTSHISHHMSTDLHLMEEFSDYMGHLPPRQWTEELLEEKRITLELDDLILLHADGSTLPASFDTTQLDGLDRDSSIWGTPGISCSKGGKILYTAPVMQQGQSTGYVLLGTKHYSTPQGVDPCTSNDTYFLMDSHGTLLSEPAGNVSLFTNEQEVLSSLSNYLRSHTAPITKPTILELNLGQSQFISAYPLGINDWLQVSILHWDQSATLSHYVQAYLWLSFCFLALSIAVVIRLVSLHKRIKKQWHDVICCDFLTGGLTNEAFQMECREKLRQKNGTIYTLVYLDTCDFKYINETWGGDCGDEVLRYIYNCFHKNLAEDELVTRSENDHFFLLLHDHTTDAIQQRLDDLLQVVNCSSCLSGNHYALRFIIGACIIHHPNEDIKVLQDRARRAAKFHDIPNVCTFYNQSILEKINRENKLNASFQESIQNHNFEVYLQPKVYLQQNQPCAAEALVRWMHPEEGLIYPSDFIPLFEENGKICELDFYVFEEVCKLIKHWQHNQRPLTEISVNLSRVHMRDCNSNFLERYCEIKKQYGIPDGIIQLELTETSMFYAQQFPHIISILGQLREAGFLCALDDFGCGYSSLSLLKEFNIDAIKLDRSFFVNESERSELVVAHMIHLAHDMGIQLVAEGIEEQQQVMRLRNLGCDLIQGYFFSKPLPVNQFEVWQDANIGVFS